MCNVKSVDVAKELANIREQFAARNSQNTATSATLHCATPTPLTQSYHSGDNSSAAVAFVHGLKPGETQLIAAQQPAGQEDGEEETHCFEK